MNEFTLPSVCMVFLAFVFLLAMMVSQQHDEHDQDEDE